MKAQLLLKRKVILADTVFAELVLWSLPRILPVSLHGYKYRLALVSDGVCVLRYDNEAGKRDHRHYGASELPYTFTGIEKLLEDFEYDIGHWIAQHHNIEDRQPE